MSSATVRHSVCLAQRAENKLRETIGKRVQPYIARKNELREEAEKIQNDPTISPDIRKKRLSSIKREKQLIKSLYIRPGKLARDRRFNAIIDFFAGQGEGTAGAINSDGICAVNAVADAVLNLKKFPGLTSNKTDEISAAFSAMAGVARRNFRHTYDIGLLRKALGPEFQTLNNLMVPFVQKLVDRWPALKAATTINGSGVHSLVALRDGTLDELFKLNSFSLKSGPSILLIHLFKLPRSFGPLIDYPRILKFASKEYHLKSVLNSFPGHASVTIWKDDGKCVDINNSFRTQVDCSSTREAHFLIYEDELGYVGMEKTVPLYRRILTPINFIFGASAAAGVGIGVGIAAATAPFTSEPLGRWIGQQIAKRRVQISRKPNEVKPKIKKLLIVTISIIAILVIIIVAWIYWRNHRQ